VTPGRGWLAGAALLAAASLGLPWVGRVTGADLPVRVAVVAAVVLAVAGLRGGRDVLLTAALAAVATGVLLGPGGGPGRITLAAAGVCLLVGSRAAGRHPWPLRAARR
jgi:hypothetical protein